MKSFLVKSTILLSVLFVFGCATPKNKQWYKEAAPQATIDANISDCKLNTFLWWPMDTLSKCMLRRGFKLITDKEKEDLMAVREQRINAEKLIELKKLKDSGVLSEAEYEEKRVKYISSF